MRVAVTADWHGYIPPEIPECDLLVVAGDIGVAEKFSFEPEVLLSDLWEFLDGLPMPVVAIAGNHDFRPDILRHLPWLYLEDAAIHAAGFKIWGSPWSNPFAHGWAYNLPEADQVELFQQIPEDTEIIISHGPPFGGSCDLTGNPFSPPEHVGSKALRARMDELPNLKLVACGHIHSGYGQDGIVVNGSLVDEAYNVANAPIVVTLELDGGS